MSKELIVPDLVWHNEKRKVKDLIPYERNPRKITEEQMEYLKKSLARYNLVDVPIIDTDGVLVSGHQRSKALSLLGRGDEEIDVRIPNRKLTEEEFKNLNIESNKLRGMFDYEMLAAEFDISELKDLGFSDIELGLGKDLDMNNKEIDVGDIEDSLEHECPKCGFRFSE